MKVPELFQDKGVYEGRASHLVDGKPSEFIVESSDVHFRQIENRLKDQGFKEATLFNRFYTVVGDDLVIIQWIEATP